jgi:hypothetical protein
MAVGGTLGECKRRQRVGPVADPQIADIEVDHGAAICTPGHWARLVAASEFANAGRLNCDVG